MTTGDYETGAGPLELAVEEQCLLLRVTRELVAAAACHTPASVADYPLQRLAECPVVGVFVTLRKAGELRGCIGNFAASTPLAEALERAALGVVSHDPRFPPVRPAELADLHISLSLLHSRQLLGTSAAERVAQVIVGQHGLDLQFHGHKGLLLPSVAVDFGWNTEQFLQAVCRKAGLPDETWRDPTATLYRFSAIKLD